MDASLVWEVLNEPIITMFGYPPMMVVLIVLSVVAMGALLAFESSRKDKKLLDTPGWLDMPVALMIAWCVSALYGWAHWEVSMLGIFLTAACGLAAFAAMLPVLLARAALRKRRNQVSN